MKKRLTIGIVGTALAATLTFVAAGSSNRGAGTNRDAATMPEAPPAYEPPGQATIIYAPAYTRGPRIIHVPQADDDDRASANYRDEPSTSNDDDDDVQTSPPPRARVMPPARTSPRWTPRSETPNPPQQRSDAPPSGVRRTVLSAPPSPPEGPSPIRPIPRFGQKADNGEKLTAPRGRTLSETSPPPGYTPPAALSKSDE